MWLVSMFFMARDRPSRLDRENLRFAMALCGSGIDPCASPSAPQRCSFARHGSAAELERSDDDDGQTGG